MNIETLKKKVTDFDEQIKANQDQIAKLENSIHWLKKRRKLVLQQMEETPETSVQTLKQITSNENP